MSSSCGTGLMGYLTMACLIAALLSFSFHEINYHESSVVNVSSYYKVNEEIVKAPFKRTVFITVDGLRADIFLNYPDAHPFLSEVLRRGTTFWGTTRLAGDPASISSHVVMLSGVAQDPTNMLGIQLWHSPVPKADSLFGHVPASACVAHENLLNVLHEESPTKLFIRTKCKIGVDTVTFEWFHEMILRKTLPRNDKMLILLNFCAIDKVGDTFKGNSLEYRGVMGIIDDLCKTVEKLVENYYGDDETLFVFASSHGVSDYLEHASSRPEVTTIPFMLWGKHLKRNVEGTRIDLRQEDMAPTIASAIGVNIPSNAVGRFETKIWRDKRFAYEGLRTSYLQLKELLHAKRVKLEPSKRLVFFPSPDEESVEGLVRLANCLNASGSYAAAIDTLQAAIVEVQKGLMYYQNYDKPLSKFLVVSTCVFWGGVLVVHAFTGARVQFFRGRFFMCSVVFGVTVLFSLSWPWRRLAFPSAAAYTGCLFFTALSRSCHFIAKPSLQFTVLLSIAAALVSLGVASDDNPAILSASLITPAIWTAVISTSPLFIKITCVTSSMLLGVFPCLPIVGWAPEPSQINIFNTFLGSLAMVTVATAALLQSSYKPRLGSRLLLIHQFVLVLSAPVVLLFSSSLLTQTVAWTAFISSFVVPVLVSRKPPPLRIIYTFLATGAPMLTVPSSHDALFFPSLAFFILASTRLAKYLEDPTTKTLFQGWCHLIAVILLLFYGTIRPYRMNPDDVHPSLTKSFGSHETLPLPIVALVKFVGPLTFLFTCRLDDLASDDTTVRSPYFVALFCGTSTAVGTFLNARVEGGRSYMIESFVNHTFFTLVPLVLTVGDILLTQLVRLVPFPHMALTLGFPIFCLTSRLLSVLIAGTELSYNS